MRNQHGDDDRHSRWSSFRWIAVCIGAALFGGSLLLKYVAYGEQGKNGFLDTFLPAAVTALAVALVLVALVTSISWIPVLIRRPRLARMRPSALFIPSYTSGSFLTPLERGYFGVTLNRSGTFFGEVGTLSIDNQSVELWRGRRTPVCVARIPLDRIQRAEVTPHRSSRGKPDEAIELILDPRYDRLVVVPCELRRFVLATVDGQPLRDSVSSINRVLSEAAAL